MKDARISIL